MAAGPSKGLSGGPGILPFATSCYRYPTPHRATVGSSCKKSKAIDAVVAVLLKRSAHGGRAKNRRWRRKRKRWGRKQLFTQEMLYH